MMRISLIRLANSVTRTFLLVPCLLICVACATPFPIENLEKGMTTEAVREEFGEPKAAEASVWGDDKSCWTYWHEEQEWFLTFFPLSPVVTLLIAAVPSIPWDVMYVTRKPVLLDFEEEKLVRWEAIEPIVTGYGSGPSYPRTKPGSGMWDRSLPPGSLSPTSSTPIVEPFPDPPTCTSIRGLLWLVHPSDS